MAVDYELLRRADPRTASTEALIFQATDWLAGQVEGGHASVWQLEPGGFKFEHNGRIYTVTVEELGHA